MNWAQFKESLTCVLLALRQHTGLFHNLEVAGSNTHFLQKYLSISTGSVDSTEFI